MVKPKTTKQPKVSLSTYERLTQDSVRKAKLEKEFRELLFEEFLIAFEQGDKAAMKKLAVALSRKPGHVECRALRGVSRHG